MNQRFVLGLSAMLLIVLLALFGTVTAAPLFQEVPPETLDAAVATLFEQTAVAQTAFPITQTVSAAFQQALVETQIPQATATAEMLQTSIPLTATAIAQPFADIPMSRTEDGAFVLGDPDAPVTIIEFADYACPHCIDYHPTIQQFIEEYVATGQAQFEYRQFPTAGGQLSAFAGQLAECADEQQPGAFWLVGEILYDLAEAGQYDETLWQPVVRTLNLDIAQLQTCVDAAQQVIIDAQYAQELGISGTPAILVRYGNGEAEFIEVDGTTYDRGSVPLEVLAQIVEAANE